MCPHEYNKQVIYIEKNQFHFTLYTLYLHAVYTLTWSF